MSMPEIRRVAIVGAGSIGVAFAVVFARAGWPVRLFDPDGARRDAAPQEITQRLNELARFGLLDEAADAVAARVQMTTSVETAVAGADLVQECAPERMDVKRALFAQFNAQDNDMLHKDFARFVKRGGRALEDHARFEALQAAQLKEANEGHWRNWADELRDPRSAAVAEFAAAHKPEVDFFLFAQWLAAKGLSHAQHVARDSGMAIGLIADLAVGCDSAGSHAWSYRDEMLQGVSVGAPPDLFNQAGQSWGLTTFSPRAMRTQGFSAFIDMLRAAFTLAGGIRIDHILGLRRLWLVPDGESAKNGAYLRYPLDDLLRLIALESWRHKAIVIGEDLGTVPPGFRERLQEHGLLGIRVLWFERAEKGPGFKAPADWDHDVAATTTTHDLPTVTGWWIGEDIVWRSKIGQTAARADGQDPVKLAQVERGEDRKLLWSAFQEAGVAAPDVSVPADISPQTAPVDEALAFVASTPAPLVIYPLEDLLALAEMPNLPGSIDEHPNWRRRLAAPDADALRIERTGLNLEPGSAKAEPGSRPLRA